MTYCHVGYITQSVSLLTHIMVSSHYDFKTEIMHNVYSCSFFPIVAHVRHLRSSAISHCWLLCRRGSIIQSVLTLVKSLTSLIIAPKVNVYQQCFSTNEVRMYISTTNLPLPKSFSPFLLRPCNLQVFLLLVYSVKLS